MSSRWLPLLAVGCVLGLTTGCHLIYKETRVAPAPDTTFLPDPGRMQEQPPEAAFQRCWIAPNVNWGRYHKVIVAPVNIDHLIRQSWWERQSYVEKLGFYQGDCRRIADYLGKVFRDELAADPQHRCQVTEVPGPDTLRLELALVELVPTKAVMNSIEEVTKMAMPMLISTAMGPLSELNAGSIAIEAKLVDSRTGRVLAMFADREKAEMAAFDLAGFTPYGQSELIVRNWGREFIRIINAHMKPVTRRLPFTLITF
ncbi:MAG: DUF3313 domain-containing protein [Lentisphaeria bacterium]